MSKGLREHETGDLERGDWSGCLFRTGLLQGLPTSFILAGPRRYHGGVYMDWEEPTVQVLSADECAEGVPCNDGSAPDECFTGNVD
jgi:hypothetical protein